jgi:methyltransferase (TIGR00027 family)
MKDGKPSRTALKVALNILTLSAKPGMDRFLPPGIVQATEKLLIASGAAGARTVRWAQSRRIVSVYEALDWMLPGQFEAFAHRKAFCERAAREGIGAGASQILVLGAGYDTMGWRLTLEFTGVNFFEIDHPATACLKAKGIDAMEQRDNLFLIAEDLGKRKLVDVLKTNEHWNRSAQSVIIAEGLLMYLPPEAVRDLFLQCAEIVGTGSRIAFSYIPSGGDGRPYVGRWTGMMLWLQKALGEPWIWSKPSEELGQFLEEAGWTIASTMSEDASKHGVEFFTVAVKSKGSNL